MTLISQTGRDHAALGLGSYNQPTGIGGWGSTSYLLYGAADFAGTPEYTCFPAWPNAVIPGCVLPAAAFPAGRQCNYMFMAQNQANPDYDISNDFGSASTSTLFSTFAFPIHTMYKVGVRTGAFCVARSPNGDTITAQWFKDGSAVGSAVTFANTWHMVIQLPDFQYELSEWIKGTTLTLRTSGGLAHVGCLVFIPRVEAVVDGADVIDAGTVYASSIADGQAASGTAVDVLLPAFTSIATATGSPVLNWAAGSVPVQEERFYMLLEHRLINQISDNVADGDFRSSLNPPGYIGSADPMDYRVYRSGVLTAFNFAVSTTGGEWTTFNNYAFNSRQDLTFVDANLSEAGGLIFQTSESLQIKLKTGGFHEAADREQHLDRVVFGRRVETMSLSSQPATSDFTSCETFDLNWQYKGPTTQGGANVDRSSLFTSVDGVVYDSAGNLLYQETGINCILSEPRSTISCLTLLPRDRISPHA